MVYQPDFKPQVYTRVLDSGIEFSIRYLCNPRKRRITSQVLWENIFSLNGIFFDPFGPVTSKLLPSTLMVESFGIRIDFFPSLDIKIPYK